MVLELTPQQIDLLHACLAESTEELHDEVLHTDHLQMRLELREKLDRLHALQRQVEALMRQQEQPSL